MFDPDNKIVKLCAQGMEMESKGKDPEAALLFTEAWNTAENDFEKFTAAHFLARQQNSAENKLHWDEKALDFALKIDHHDIKSSLPSLYLNIAKCHEDLDNLKLAVHYYSLARSSSSDLPENTYGDMIRSGIKNGLERVGVK